MKRKKMMALGLAAALMCTGGAIPCAAQEAAPAEAEAEEKDPAEVLYDQYMEASKARENEKAMEYLMEGAELGDTRCIMTIGQNYLEGNCVEQDYEKAMEYLQKATDAGDRKAPRYIGMMYENGWGVDSDYSRAAEYFQIGADNGDITSQYYLGRYYEFGKGVEQDYAKAMELYEMAAERGDATAAVGMLGIASLYEHGRGVEQSLDTAKEWYDKAAEAGYEMASLNPKMISAITRVYGDGERICAVAIEFNEEIDGNTIDMNTFSVEGRTVTNIYVNTEAALSEEGTQAGNFVIIELDPFDSDEAAPVYEGGIINGGNGPQGDRILKYVYARVTQETGIYTTDGDAYIPDGTSFENHEVISPDTDKFEQLVYEDSENGNSLMYNLYVPENYSEAESYPLVLFMADAGANGDDVFMTLRQGNGATVWASAEEQEKHPSFVVAPQFTGNEPETINDTIMKLLNSLKEEYSIDASRVYTTGQSQGCIKSIALDLKYPDTFAGLLLVAGQGDAEEMRAMEGENIWIIVSEGDKQAYPGMNEAIAAWEEDGTVISKAVWDANWTDEEYNNAVEEMRAEENSIKYSTYAKGTTWDGDPSEEDPNEHNSTMHYAYGVEGVRDWLFEQVLGETNF